MPVNAKNLTSAAEAVLFSVGEPLEIGKLAEVLSVDEETCRRTLLNLSASLDERSSGICLLRLGDKYQLSSRTEYADLIRSVLEVKKNAPLSNAAFEVLAVIAYNQPVTKAFVEQVRGIEPPYSAWEADVLPLNYTCLRATLNILSLFLQ